MSTYKAVCVRRMKQRQGDNNKLIIIVWEAATKTLFSSSSFPDVTQDEKQWVCSGQEAAQRNAAS